MQSAGEGQMAINALQVHHLPLQIGFETPGVRKGGSRQVGCLIKGPVSLTRSEYLREAYALAESFAVTKCQVLEVPAHSSNCLLCDGASFVCIHTRS